MTISTEVYGYVVARGRRSVAQDPFSRYNAVAMEEIARLASLIDNLDPALRRQSFSAGDAHNGCLRGTAFEINEATRPALFHVLDCMGANGAAQGTLVVPKLDHLSRRGAEQTNRERQAMRLLDGSAIAILTLDDPVVRRLLARRPADVTANDVASLVLSGLDRRQKIRRWLDAIESSGVEPTKVEPDEMKDADAQISMFSA